MMEWKAKWIKPVRDMEEVCSVFQKNFLVSEEVSQAVLSITALGVYEAKVNGERVSDYVLAPGWTAYGKRLQYQQYDITQILKEENEIAVTVGKGWYRGRFAALVNHPFHDSSPCSIIAQIDITYADGREECIVTDTEWGVTESEIRFSELYDGEVCDGSFQADRLEETEVYDGPSQTLIPQEGEKIIEQEIFPAVKIIDTPKGERVIDFGQEVTGYIELTVDAKAGEKISLSHGEMLDGEGNFYNENYRSAKAELHYICRDGKQTYHPRLTFYGFRYARIDAFPGGVTKAKPENFRAIAVYSEMKRTGYVSCSSPLLNRLFENIIWGQKDNYLDVPTDCPQRDERLGWTGDAQIFIKAATYNFDVEKFFYKWLNCLKAEQMENGYVGHTIPDMFHNADFVPLKEVDKIYECSLAGWGDAAVICPWELYMAYGNPDILKRQFHSMKMRIEYITNTTTTENLWTGSLQNGDWLGLDSPPGSYKGSSRDDFIASAYYAYSTSLVIKAGKVLGEDVSKYEKLYERIIKAFREAFPTYTTQTECAMAVHFRIPEDCQKVADQLAQMIRETGHLTTGFLGTPYLLHALSDFGYLEEAYNLLLREEFPSWLYSVRQGATTIWEHWDGYKEDGSFWDKNMNSFNHYAYGAVIDWVYSVAAGIRPLEAGYQKVQIAPRPDARLDWLKVDFETRQGALHSEWKKEGNEWKYEIITPVDAEIVIAGKTMQVKAGEYSFCGGEIYDHSTFER